MNVAKTEYRYFQNISLWLIWPLGRNSGYLTYTVPFILVYLIYPVSLEKIHREISEKSENMAKIENRCFQNISLWLIWPSGRNSGYHTYTVTVILENGKLICDNRILILKYKIKI